MSDPAPHRVGKYEILGRIGRGGMGTVYRARDPLLEREVALKLILGEGNAETRERFGREARILANISHANIVTIFEFGFHEESPFIAMELLRGRDLDHAMQETPSMSLEERIGVVRQALTGLGRAHRAGVVHRDIKPANVFVTTDGEVKLLDFGVARLSGGAMTSTGRIIGSEFYMSPEQWTSAAVDGRSDLFSTGVMLYELIAGVRPFAGDVPFATMRKTLNEEPDFAPIRARAPVLIPILQKALAKDAAARYQSAADFAAAFESLGTEDLRLVPTLIVAPPSPPSPPSPPPPQSPPSPQPPPSNDSPDTDIAPPAARLPTGGWLSKRMMLITAAVVVVLAITGWALYRYSSEPRIKPSPVTQTVTGATSTAVYETSTLRRGLFREYEAVLTRNRYPLPPVTTAQRGCIERALTQAENDRPLDIAALHGSLNLCAATSEPIFGVRRSPIIASVQARLAKETRYGPCYRFGPVMVDGRHGFETSAALESYVDCERPAGVPRRMETLGDYVVVSVHFFQKRGPS